MTEKELAALVEDWFATGTKIIHPAFPAYLTTGEKVEFEHRDDGWYWQTSAEEKGPFNELAEARRDRTDTAVGRLEAERKGK